MNRGPDRQVCQAVDLTTSDSLLGPLPPVTDPPADRCDDGAVVLSSEHVEAKWVPIEHVADLDYAPEWVRRSLQIFTARQDWADAREPNETQARHTPELGASDQDAANT